MVSALADRLSRVISATPFPLYRSRLIQVRRNAAGMVVSQMIPAGAVEPCGLPERWTYTGESETIQPIETSDNESVIPGSQDAGDTYTTAA